MSVVSSRSKHSGGKTLLQDIGCVEIVSLKSRNKQTNKQTMMVMVCIYCVLLQFNAFNGLLDHTVLARRLRWTRTPTTKTTTMANRYMQCTNRGTLINWRERMCTGEDGHNDTHTHSDRVSDEDIERTARNKQLAH